MSWTELPDKTGTTMTVHSGAWTDLLERIRTVGAYSSKDKCPLVKLATFGDVRSVKGSLRHNENTQAIYGIEGDYDGEQVPMDRAAEILESYGIRAALYPSPSSTPERPRWRVIAPLARQHVPSEREGLVARLNGALGGILAGESFTLSQCYFFGATPSNEYRVGVTFDDPEDGKCIDDLTELDKIAIGKTFEAATLSTGTLIAPAYADPAVVRDLRSALTALRADDRVLWVAVGHALKTLGDQGRSLWLEWSQTSDKYDPQDAATKWDTFNPTNTGYQAVFAKAQAEGWVNPASEHKSAPVDSPQPEHIDLEVDEVIQGGATAARDATNWPKIADPFAKYPVPAFPVDTLPDAFQLLCRELSAQSGFDIGGYAFALLVTASSLVDHQKKMSAGPLSVPTFLWGGLVANSGGGKSPTLTAVTKKVRALNEHMVKESQRELMAWVKLCEATKPEDRKGLPPRPAWKQLIASDTTVEALGALLKDNPTGMLLAHDELTEFIGRMDAYSGNGSGKDRGVYLRSFDGGSVIINRAPPRAPMIVDNFSVGIITGIQPEKLGELFKKSGGGSDGLYQRFLVYAMQPAGNVDYTATLGIFTDINAGQLMGTLHDWTQAAEGGIGYATLCDEALPLMQAYHQQIRTLAQRTPAKRFAEHLDKFPGFLARITFTLHCIECAASGEFQKVVGRDTFLRAKRIMQTMYHHSAAVYEVLDSQSGEQSRLIKSACEAILAKGWQTVSSGDLTRYATDWRGSDDRLREASLDTLIELGWLRDITPAPQRGKRGRRSSGLFLVNPKAHLQFSEQSERIKADRSARFQAIQAVASARDEDKTNE